VPLSESTPLSDASKSIETTANRVFFVAVVIAAAILGSTFRPGEAGWEKLPKVLSYLLFVILMSAFRVLLVWLQQVKLLVERIDERLRAK